MARKITVVISQGQSASPIKRKLEEDLVAALLFEPNVEVTVIPHLYDLSPDGTGILCLRGITGDMIVLSWLFPRAAAWTLSRNDIRGHLGTTLLVDAAADDEDEEERDLSPEPAGESAPTAPLPNRRIHCIDLRVRTEVAPFVEEVRRIVGEANVQTVGLMSWVKGSPKTEQLDRYLHPTGAAAEPPPPSQSKESAPPTATAPAITRVEEPTVRRWYPVIDFSRCTNCLECLDFCLFGVYGVDGADHILVEQPDNCRKGCPACSRVCPANAIIFPQHKAPTIAGGAEGEAGGLKIDLSKLFGAPDAMRQAALERDVELVAVGRDAVGMTVGIPKRQSVQSARPKDKLDDLIDALDDLGL